MIKLELDFFNSYLKKQGNELSKMSDLLPYFALPMIKSPLMNHPTFSKIFTKDWVYELRSQLVEFLNSMYSLDDQPFLIHMYQEYVSKKEPENTPEDYQKLVEERNQYAQYVNELENNNRELVDILQDYHNKYKSLEDYVKNKNDGEEDRGDVIIQQKWATFSREILRLANDIYSYTKKKIDDEEDKRLHSYQQKLDDFQNFLTINLDDLMMNQQTSTNQGSVEEEKNEFEEPVRESFKQSEILDLKYPVLDFEKLKGFLASTGEQTYEIVTTILNSLRRRLAGNDIIARKQTLYTFIYTDAFDIKNSRNTAEPIFKVLLNSESVEVKTAYTRLLNMIAFDSIGRSYLTENTELIALLIKYLQTEKEDSHLRKRCLGILQNLSLRKKSQTIMIRGNLIETCFKILETENLSGYSHEYFSALLMNLCLRREGKERCETNPQRYLKILQGMLEYDVPKHPRLGTFVNGILYSLLGRDKVKKAAKEINLLEYLEKMRQDVDERFQKQIDFIIQQAEKNDSSMEDSFEEEDDFDVDGRDEEILEDDVSDMPQMDDDQEIGEEFLIKNFAADQNDEKKIIRYIKTCMEEVKYPAENLISNKSYKPLDRPTTPSMMASNPYGYHIDEDDRNLPSEMKHRPRLVRTPADGVSPSLVMNNGSGLRDSDLPPEKIEKLQKEQNDDEWQQGFRSRPKITRTPFTEDFVGMGKI